MTPGIFFTLEATNEKLFSGDQWKEANAAKVLKAWYVEDVPKENEFHSSDFEGKNGGCSICEAYLEALESCKAKAIEFAPEFVSRVKHSVWLDSPYPYNVNEPDLTKIYPVPPELNIEKQYQYMTNHWTVLNKYEWDKYGENVRKRVVMILQSSVKREDKPKSHKAKLEEEVKTLKFEKECADDEYVQLRREYESLKEQLKAADEVIELTRGIIDIHSEDALKALEKYNSLKSSK